MDVQFRDKKMGVQIKNASKYFGAHAEKIQKLYYILSNAGGINDIKGLPQLACHQLQGNRQGTYALKIDKRFRLTFRLLISKAGTVIEIINLLEQYH